jgi:hypothetical protein
MNNALKSLCAVTVMMISISAHAALVSVTQDGGLMVSDSALNVTWADTAPSSPVNWPGAQAWVASLNTADYGGYNNWTLATGDGTYTTGFATHGYGLGASTSGTANQLGYLFINELGNTPGSIVTNFGPFTTLMANEVYWSGSAYEYNPGNAWNYDTHDSVQGDAFDTTSDFGALAVRSGDTPVPLPAAAWLLLSGLGGLGLFGRKRRA